MTYPALDTNLLIRFLSDDESTHRAQATHLFEQIEQGELTAQAYAVIFVEAVFVLSSPRLYNLPRAQVQEVLSEIIRLPHLRVEHRAALLEALIIWRDTPVKFVDALIVAIMRAQGASLLYSFDHHFDRFSDISRTEPDAPLDRAA